MRDHFMNRLPAPTSKTTTMTKITVQTHILPAIQPNIPTE
jgi:hypothetical protein